MKEINLTEVVEEVQQQQKFVAKEKNILLQQRVSAEAGKIYTDITHLRVILNNLLGNAIRYADFSKASPFVEIRAYKAPGGIVIEVRDNGLGIAPEHQSRIFEMFYRAHEKAQGSGLGLHLVKQSVEKLGGQIKVNSQVGEGTTFQLFLPSPKAPEPAAKMVRGQIMLA
ncbi:MAG: ATP-binding protein [Microscillaceae bacterium]|nr:ATP-binding protein [Microscillaceae bacterium]